MTLSMDPFNDLREVYLGPSPIMIALVGISGCLLIKMILMFIFAHKFFKIHADGVSCCMDEDCCCPFQKARFFKCMKRRSKNRKASSTCTASITRSLCSCPFDSGILAFVPPLPFRRTRKKQRAVPITTQKRNEQCKVEHGRIPVLATIRCNSSREYQDEPSSSTNVQGVSINNNSKKTTAPCESSTTVPVGISADVAHFRNLMPWTLAGQLDNSSSFQTSLLDLARMQQWPALIQRCNRRQCKQQDSDGLYPLHWACSGGAPVEAVQALLAAYPRAARRASYQRSTALHFACHYGSSLAVVEVLLKAYPDAAKIHDRLGRTPLFHAVFKGSNMDILQAVVEADPTAVLQPLPKSGHTPLYFAWVAVLRDGRYRTKNSTKSKKWNKAVYLLQTACQEISSHVTQRKRKTTLDTFKILPAIIQLLPYLPQGTLELVVHACPQQLVEADEVTGLLPLSLAASLVVPRDADRVIKTLLDAHHEAATKRDYQGKSALALALSSGKLWDQGVSRLVNAAPESVGWIDNDSSLPPFALAAIDCPFTSRQDQEPDRASERHDTGLVHPFLPKGDKELNEKRPNLLLSTHHEPFPLHQASKDQKEDTVILDPESSRIGTIYELLLRNPAMLKVALK